ncbi:MAG TPA: PHB depolymerase family esterase [Candidatus Acidoferrum sp.]|nr:PHB depolymerase family esterase [Candidatus Acidoferrum sp.]
MPVLDGLPGPFHRRHSFKVSVFAAGVVCLVALFAMTRQKGIAGEDSHRGSLYVDGRARTYFVHTPPGYNGTKPLPLVVVLHGGGGNAEGAEKISGMSPIADRENFLAAYPNGTGLLENRLLTWNVGVCCGYAMKHRVDDVAFLRGLLDKLGHDYSVDRKRIYVTGMSNGGMMTYYAACELSDRIAAISPVAGALDNPCHPTNPVSVIIFHGTKDEFVPFNGGVGPRQLGGPRDDKPVSYAVDFWVRKDGCNPAPKRTETRDLRTDVYSGCKDGTTVILNAVLGQDHAWPGGNQMLRMLPPPNPNVHASEMMWEFFAAHPKH